MKRVMCVWFPNWPLQRVLSGRPELKRRPCVLYQMSGRRGAQVTAFSPEAGTAGVVAGMPLAEAQALLEAVASDSLPEPLATLPRGVRCSGVPESSRVSTVAHAHYELHDTQADLAGLRRLAWRCQAFTPSVGVDQSEDPDSLLLDITGCAHLFGNEREMAAQVTLSLYRQGLLAQVGLASTIGAAWAIAHYGAHTAGLPLELGSLPVEALRIPDKLVQQLHEFDLGRVGQVTRLPRSSLPSRFGSILAMRLDQARGHAPEILVPERPPELLEARWSFAEPVVDRRIVQTAIRRLIEELIQKLQTRREGIVELVMCLQSTGSKSLSADEPALQPGESPLQFSLELVRPSISAPHMLELLGMQMEARDVLDIHIQVTRTAPLPSQQHELFNTGGARDGSQELDRLLERLSSRLGQHVVLCPQLEPDAQPELAVRYVPLIELRRNCGRLFARGPGAPTSRPLCLHLQPVPVSVTSVVPAGPPIRLHLNKQVCTIVQRYGPERIETGWWRARPIRRDYYRIELSSGRWFWLFRNLDDGQWFLHGSFE